jgi:hypothetical protein
MYGTICLQNIFKSKRSRCFVMKSFNVWQIFGPKLCLKSMSFSTETRQDLAQHKLICRHVGAWWLTTKRCLPEPEIPPALLTRLFSHHQLTAPFLIHCQLRILYTVVASPDNLLINTCSQILSALTLQGCSYLCSHPVSINPTGILLPVLTSCQH